ncbi:hypothetical protein [Taibaiella koreensis]|uniref:hypothetical protein n=1 Tax=Taibaiella koreensis TaxID=1268548 RepID=UPI000E59F945|nr:hypothetical protein [Taibaiella koreensis]
MKYTIFGLILFTCCSVTKPGRYDGAQPSSHPELVAGKCDTCPRPLIILNGSERIENLVSVDPGSVGCIFWEKEVSPQEADKGRVSCSSAFVYRYPGAPYPGGIIFVFTRDRVDTISERALHKAIGKAGPDYFFKIGDKPITNNPACLHQLSGRVSSVIQTRPLSFSEDKRDPVTLFIVQTRKP